MSSGLDIVELVLQIADLAIDELAPVQHGELVSDARGVDNHNVTVDRLLLRRHRFLVLRYRRQC